MVLERSVIVKMLVYAFIDLEIALLVLIMNVFHLEKAQLNRKI